MLNGPFCFLNIVPVKFNTATCDLEIGLTFVSTETVVIKGFEYRLKPYQMQRTIAVGPLWVGIHRSRMALGWNPSHLLRQMHRRAPGMI